MSVSRSYNREDQPDAGRAESSPALLTRLERGGGDVNTYVNTPVPGWIEQLLRIPLPLKLVGANILLLVAAAATALVLRQRELNTAPVLAVVIVAFVAALLINTGLVMLAVR